MASHAARDKSRARSEKMKGNNAKAMEEIKAKSCRLSANMKEVFGRNGSQDRIKAEEHKKRGEQLRRQHAAKSHQLREKGKAEEADGR